MTSTVTQSTLSLITCLYIDERSKFYRQRILYVFTRTGKGQTRAKVEFAGTGSPLWYLYVPNLAVLLELYSLLDRRREILESRQQRI
jgi:purine-nucleoside phosphorylase